MSDNEKVALVQSMIGDMSISNEIILAYLSLALQRIADKLYPFGTETQTVPSRYDMLQCEIAVRMIAKIGGEGEISHSENGISRTWASVDDSDLLSRVVPYVGYNNV